jgi:hypothetical protein
MLAAAPLARTALLTFANGRPLTLPTRPSSIEPIHVCEVSGGRPGPHCTTKLDLAPHGHALSPCTWHHADGTLHLPQELRQWGDRLMGRKYAR